MIRVGLTGGIGSGKSTVSNFLKEIGIKIVDADIISREVLLKYPEALVEIKRYFGQDVFNEDGNLNRKALGERIFASDSDKAKLEEIIIPRIKEEVFKQFHEYEIKGEEIVILDAPTLMENNMHKDMDVNLLIWVDEEVQISRVMQRDDLDREQVLMRIRSQMSLEEKKKYADFIIDNRYSVGDTLNQIKKILGELRKWRN